jgi:hypothetical protein
MVPLLSEARIAPYHYAYPNCDNVRLGSIYAWQAELGSAWHEVLGYTEVLLRNAVDSSLAVWNALQPSSTSGTNYGADWLDGPAPTLAALAQRARTEARVNATNAKNKRPTTHPRKHDPISHDDLLAQLTFGNLVYLLPNPQRPQGARARRSGTGFTKAENIWLHGVHKGFPNIDAVFVRKKSLSSSAAIVDQGVRVAETARRLLSLRNRVAHHEQTLSVAHPDRHHDATRLVAAIDPDAATALGEISQVLGIFAAAP